MNKNPNIAVIGGGTGVSILLRGLKKFTENISAIITVGDDGGGSGRLREDLGMLPPGDIRSCILALANTEPSMERVLQFRFTSGELKGQSIGNLFLAALDQMYGNFETAVNEACKVLAVTGQVFPVTINHMNIEAKLKNGEIVIGESKIPEIVKRSKSPIDTIKVGPRKLKPVTGAINAIEKADLVVLGPGSLYTSIIPNLLVEGVVDAMRESTAKVAYIANVMTQPGETDDYSLTDHVKALIKHSRGFVPDMVICNTEVLDTEVVYKYKKDGSKQVLPSREDESYICSIGSELIVGNFIDTSSKYIVHDNLKISSLLYDLASSTKIYIHDKDF